MRANRHARLVELLSALAPTAMSCSDRLPRPAAGLPDASGGESATRMEGDDATVLATEPPSDAGAADLPRPILHPECAGTDLPGTLEELSTTPRDDSNLELLALALRPGLTADARIYDRVVRDVVAVRALDPRVAHIRYFPWIDGRTVILLVTPEAKAEMAAGGYRPWDCLNAYFGVLGTTTLSSLDFAFVELKGIYDTARVATLYAKLPGVSDAHPNHRIGDGPTICATEEGDTIHWVFDDAGDDCPAGCTSHKYYYFTTTPNGPPLLHASGVTGGWVDRYGHPNGTTCRRQ